MIAPDSFHLALLPKLLPGGLRIEKARKELASHG